MATVRTLPSTPAPTSAEDAQAAVVNATRNLNESYRRWPSVRRLGRSLDHELETNHLGARIQETYRSG